MYTFKKSGNAVIICEHEFEHPPMDEAALKTRIQAVRLHRDDFSDEGQYRNAVLMYELALKFLQEEQA